MRFRRDNAGRRRRRGFTLLELLAAVALLVILGSMLFEIFGKSSQVVRIASARQEVFQYARAALEFIDRELTGAFTTVDANPGDFVRGMRIYNTDAMGANCQKRDASQGIFLSTGIMARDTRETVNGSPNKFFGHDVNCARIAYYLNRGPTDPSSALYNQLQHSAVYRTEMYRLSDAVPDAGTPFVRNCLYFNVLVMSRFKHEDWNKFVETDWDSDTNVTCSGGYKRRRGLPQALDIRMRITDESHAKLYRWDASGKRWFVPGPIDGQDYASAEDPIVQSFSQMVYFGRRSD